MIKMIDIWKQYFEQPMKTGNIVRRTERTWIRHQRSNNYTRNDKMYERSVQERIFRAAKRHAKR